MEGRIRLATFIVIFSASIILSFHLDDSLNDAQNANPWWGAIVASPLIIVLVFFGFLARNFKQYLVNSFFAGLVLVIFLFTQMYFELNENEDWVDINRTRTSFVLYSCAFMAAVFLTTLAFSSLGMFLSYAYKAIFKSAKSDESELQ